MTPAARLQATIEVLQDTLDTTGPADRTAQAYFRKRRYIGSKDRRSIQDRLWRVWRRRARLNGESGRDLVLKDAVIEHDPNLPELKDLCTGEGHAPSRLSEQEAEMLAAAALSDAPECPGWILPKFDEAFGANAPEELAALAEPAPVDLRVNSLKASASQVQAALAKEGLTAQPIPDVSLGLRLSRRANLTQSNAFTKGWVEVQDAGSQLAAAAVEAAPGMTVLDLCAGAGGKTLALAAQMQNRGQIIACDVAASKLDELKKRARRAGATNIRAVLLKPGQPVAEQLPRHGFDRVLIDAPCSGSGTWRRAPDAKWKLTEQALGSYVAAQKDLLSQAHSLVGPEGRVIYVTCSMLPEENQHIPPKLVLDGVTRLITPYQSQTDGFFIASFSPE